MTFAHFIEVRDKHETVLLHEEAGNRQDFAEGDDPAVWRAVLLVPVGGKIEIGAFNEGKRFTQRLLTCKRKYHDNEEDGIYVLIERRMGKKHFYNKNQYKTEISDALFSAITFCYDDEYIKIEKATEDNEGGESIEALFLLEGAKCSA